MKLGIARPQRPSGDRSENWELPIAAFNDVASVWARAQSRGRAAEIERRQRRRQKARVCRTARFRPRAYRASEPQRNRESALRREKAPEEDPDWAAARSGPEEWAATHLKLGVAYRERLAGNRSKNREGAIACFKNAPSAWTRERNPKELAAAHPRDNVPGALRRVAGEPSIQWRQGSAAPANALPTRLAEPVGDHAGTTPVLEDCFLTHARRCQCHVPGKPKSGNLPLRGSERRFDNQNDKIGISFVSLRTRPTTKTLNLGRVRR
jgi:hypothetical protein